MKTVTPKTLVFYKPYGVLCQFTQPEGTESRLTLKEFIDCPNVYPIGRLDYDSEGLLLLTNDGRLQYALGDHRFAHRRTYWVQVERIPQEQDLAPLRRGIAIQDYVTRPAQVSILPTEPDLPPRDPPIRWRKSVPTAWLELILTEGRNRQVRRMTAAIGFPTLRLVRVAIALDTKHQITLAGLEPGQWRELTPQETTWLPRLRPKK